MNLKLSALIASLVVATPFVAANTFASELTVADTAFVALDADDPDMAALVGLATYKVDWFNGATLFSRTLGAAEGHVIIVADGVDDPRGRTFTATGDSWTITDLNDAGVSWTTTEYTFTDDSAASQTAYIVTVGSSLTDGLVGASGEAYNFVALVDTSVLGGGSLGAGGADASTLDVDVFVDDGAPTVA